MCVGALAKRKAGSYFAAGLRPAIARTHKWKTMRPARCNLHAAACGILAGRSTGRMVFYVCVRAIAFMFVNTQHASEIAENSY